MNRTKCLPFKPSIFQRIRICSFLFVLASILNFGVSASSQDIKAESTNRTSSPAQASPLDSASDEDDYRIGPGDVLEISVFEAPDLNRSVRVSGAGEVTLPPLGVVKTGGLTARQLEITLEGSLRRTYVKNPHVGVFVKEIQSHPVFVFGLVGKPGMYQLRGGRSLIEVLSMAGGTLEAAGDNVIVVRRTSLAAGSDRQGQASAADHANVISGAADAEGAANKTEEARENQPATQIMRVNLRELLESGSAASRIPVESGDIVTVPPPMFVYIVGDVSKPGGYPFKNNASLWQMMALAGGPTPLAAKNRARIVRIDKKTGERTEIPVDLNKVLLAKIPGPALRPEDILYVPPAGAKHVLDRAATIGLASAPAVIVALISIANQ